jgi:hypothetical protein
MTRRLTEFKNLKKITLWVDDTQWVRFGLIVGEGNRSDHIRQFIDRAIVRQTNKGLKKK